MGKNNCIILAGGTASRFGETCEAWPKALLKIGQATNLENAISAS